MMNQTKFFSFWKTFKTWSIRLLVFILFSELGLMIVANVGLIDCQHPTYTLQSDSQYLAKFDPSIGFIHRPKSSYILKLNCTDKIKYTFNSIGFLERDLPRNISGKRIILLGDSFMEGYGVKPSDRLSNRLEKLTKIQIANLGMSDKGTVHYLKIYEKFASQLDHDAVLIALFPTNDFYDDYSEEAIKGYSPYWKKVDNTWKLKSPIHKKKDKEEPGILKKILKEFTYTYNVYLQLRSQQKQKKLVYFDHFNHSAIQWERMKLSLLSLKASAKSKKIAIFTIPGKHEITNDSFKLNPLTPKLKTFCDSIGIEYIPLAESIFELKNEDRHLLYNPCEIHWSSKGHNFAAKIIREHWSIFKTVSK